MTNANKELFTARRQRLVSWLNDRLAIKHLSKEENESLLRILGVLDECSYENRLRVKGRLTYMIIDGMACDNSVAEKVIGFDKSIT